MEKGVRNEDGTRKRKNLYEKMKKMRTMKKDEGSKNQINAQI